MIAGTLRILSGSSRWLPPFLLLLIWVSILLSNPGPSVSNHVGAFGGLLIFALWVTVTIGNLDADPHRDLMAAAAGSTARLHGLRAGTAVLVAGAMGCIIAAVSTAVGTEPDKQVAGSLAIGAALGVAAALMGAGIGTWLHRPVLCHRGAATLLAVAALTGTIVLPPLQAALRAVGEGKDAMVLAVLVPAAVWAVVSILVAARAASTLAR
jgi:hypothetical protein